MLPMKATRPAVADDFRRHGQAGDRVSLSDLADHVSIGICLAAGALTMGNRTSSTPFL